MTPTGIFYFALVVAAKTKVCTGVLQIDLILANTFCIRKSLSGIKENERINCNIYYSLNSIFFIAVPTVWTAESTANK
jgi:hypothetical protein